MATHRMASRAATIAAGIVVLIVGSLALSSLARPTPSPSPGDPATQAVHFGIDFLVPANGTASGSYTVPAGKRLAIEYLTIRGNNGTMVYRITTTLNGETVTYFLGGEQTTGGWHIDDSANNVRIYADGGTDVIISAVSTSSGEDGVTASVSGYFINL